MATADMWTWRDQSWAGQDVEGFDVEATDGGIGKVDEATHDVGGAFIVVDTGPWIFGKKVLLPAGVVDTVDIDEGKVFVKRTKDEIKNAPEFDEAMYKDEAYRRKIGGYYASPTRERTRL